MDARKHEQPLAAACNAPRREDTTASPADILVVDDDPKNLTAMEVALGELAHRLVSVSSGEEALRELLARDYAVILLDVQMPGMDGFETARLIRSRWRTRRVPIIFITAYSQNDADMRKGYELGAVDYLFKPIVPEILRAKVQVFVELRERTDEVARQAEQLRDMERTDALRRLDEERRKWEAETLRKENQQLEGADRQKDQFIAMLAHELRNPLAPLVTSLELIRMADVEDPDVTKARDVMSRQLRHLTRLVDDLLDVSRICQNKLQLHRETVELGSLVEESIEACRSRIEEQGHDLEIGRAPERIMLQADPVRVTQIVSNLLNNAVRYTDRGGAISVGWEADGSEAVVRVKDTGRGIDPQLQPRIFDMFVQERDGGRGLGLGLTLVRQLTELHDGSVSAHSDGLGKGSEFIIRLPLTADTARCSEPEEPELDAAEARSLSIAVIEDDEDVRGTVVSLLERWGHDVHVASSGAEGIDIVLDMRPDVALLDIGLPGIDGYDIARKIHHELGQERPQLVAMTGFGQEHDRKRALDAGFDAHLVKPAHPEALRRALRKRG